MSVDVWFTHDIEQIILAAVHANEEAIAAGMLGSDPLRQRSYHQGFRAALSTLALALGLPQLPTMDDHEQCTVLDSALPVRGSHSSVAARERGDDAQQFVLSGVRGEVCRGDGPALV
ncbi:MAG TPA: hypothetical protein VMW79_05060 [Anaerolineae bacterium]|nr:hypothetical protein [Anaerolineae bacterium]